jgi:hypothetical protein
MEVISYFPDSFLNLIRENTINEEIYNFNTRLSCLGVSHFLKFFCDQMSIKDEIHKNITFTSYKYNYKDCKFKEIFSISESTYTHSKLNISAPEHSVILTIYNVKELISKNSRNKYVFVPIEVIPTNGFNYEDKRERHLTLLLINMVDKTIHYVDSNGFGDVFRSISKNEIDGSTYYTRFTLDELFVNYVTKVLPEYEYIPINKWLISAEKRGLQIDGGYSRAFDNGNCQTITLILCHCLSSTNFDLLDIYKIIGSLKPEDKANLIYSYECGIYNFFIETLIF